MAMAERPSLQSFRNPFTQKPGPNECVTLAKLSSELPTVDNAKKPSNQTDWTDHFDSTDSQFVVPDFGAIMSKGDKVRTHQKAKLSSSSKVTNPRNSKEDFGKTRRPVIPLKSRLKIKFRLCLPQLASTILFHKPARQSSKRDKKATRSPSTAHKGRKRVKQRKSANGEKVPVAPSLKVTSHRRGPSSSTASTSAIKKRADHKRDLSGSTRASSIQKPLPLSPEDYLKAVSKVRPASSIYSPDEKELSFPAIRDEKEVTLPAIREESAAIRTRPFLRPESNIVLLMQGENPFQGEQRSDEPTVDKASKEEDSDSGHGSHHVHFDDKVALVSPPLILSPSSDVTPQPDPSPLSGASPQLDLSLPSDTSPQLDLSPPSELALLSQHPALADSTSITSVKPPSPLRIPSKDSATHPARKDSLLPPTSTFPAAYLALQRENADLRSSINTLASLQTDIKTRITPALASLESENVQLRTALSDASYRFRALEDSVSELSRSPASSTVSLPATVNNAAPLQHELHRQRSSLAHSVSTSQSGDETLINGVGSGRPSFSSFNNSVSYGSSTPPLRANSLTHLPPPRVTSMTIPPVDRLLHPAAKAKYYAGTSPKLPESTRLAEALGRQEADLRGHREDLRRVKATVDRAEKDMEAGIEEVRAAKRMVGVGAAKGVVEMGAGWI